MIAEGVNIKMKVSDNQYDPGTKGQGQIYLELANILRHEFLLYSLIKVLLMQMVYI